MRRAGFSLARRLCATGAGPLCNRAAHELQAGSVACFSSMPRAGGSAASLAAATWTEAALPGAVRAFRSSATQLADVTVSVPSMGESITEGTVAAILKQPGEVVVEDDVIAQLETDKVTMDIKYQNKTPGIIKSIQAAEGDTVSVGQDFAVVEENAEAAAGAPTAGKEEAPAAGKEETPAAGKEEAPAAGKEAPAQAPSPPKPAAAPQPPKPAAAPQPPKPAPKQQQQQQQEAAPPAPGQRPERRVPMTRLRRRVAERLKGAQNTYAMLSTFNEVDMTNVMEMRRELKDAFLERHGVKLGFMSAFVKAAGAALQYVPAVNGVIDGNDIIYRDYYDISVAVATPKGLVVPVLRDVDQMSFADVEKKINEFGRKARDGTLSIDEMAGGTFTISNGGVFGSMLSTPIINPPQSAILGMHATNMRPYVVNGQIMPRPIMNLALTYDHRLIDGREAVTFLKRIKEIVEDPRRLLLDV